MINNVHDVSDGTGGAEVERLTAALRVAGLIPPPNKYLLVTSLAVFLCVFFFINAPTAPEKMVV